MSMRITTHGVAGLLIAVLACLLPRGSMAECAAIALPAEPPPFVLIKDETSGRILRVARELSLHPTGEYTALIFGEAHVLAIDTSCSCAAPSGKSLTLYDPDGTVRWQRTLEELLPDTALHPRAGRLWYESIRRSGERVDRDAHAVFVLLNFDELWVRLSDGTATRREVPLTALQNDSVKLRARARYLGRRDDRAGQEVAYRAALANDPLDHEAALGLAGVLSNGRRHAQAVAVLSEVERQLDLAGRATTALRIELRYRQASYLESSGSLAPALQIVSAGLNLDPDEPRLLRLHGDLLVKLQRVAEALPSYRRLIAHHARHFIASRTGPTDSYPAASTYYSEVEQIAGLMRYHGYAAQASDLQRHPPARAEMLAILRTLNDSQYAQGYAIELARIYLGAQDDRNAIEWYTLATDKHRRFLVDATPELALCYLRRHSVAPNVALAVRFCDEAAAQGSAAGKFWSSMLRLGGLVPGADLASAKQLLREVLEPLDQGNYFDSGYFDLQQNHQDVPAGMVADYQWAARVLEPLARQGEVVVQKALRALYASKTRLGSAANQDRSSYFESLAAAAGDVRMMMEAGSCTQMHWYERALAAGHAAAASQIASCHLNGKVARPDFALAESMIRRYALAADPTKPWEGQSAERLFKRVEAALGRTVPRPVAAEKR